MVRSKIPSATLGRWDNTSRTLRRRRWSVALVRCLPRCQNPAAKNRLPPNLELRGAPGNGAPKHAVMLVIDNFAHNFQGESRSTSQATHQDAELILKLYDL